MELNFNTCYQAVKCRDPRFDGRFFTGVISTGIFCRPVCPAVTPKPGNCRFYPSAFLALEAGFRPCLRCRPETVPDSPAWNGVRTTVKRALSLIDSGALDEGTVKELAERLGVSDRYLRHLFARYVGSSPQSMARARRASIARRLIADGTDSMTCIAHKAGFTSVRQFNDTFYKIYGISPSALRRQPTLSPGPK